MHHLIASISIKVNSKSSVLLIWGEIQRGCCYGFFSPRDPGASRNIYQPIALTRRQTFLSTSLKKLLSTEFTLRILDSCLCQDLVSSITVYMGFLSPTIRKFYHSHVICLPVPDTILDTWDISVKRQRSLFSSESESILNMKIYN